MIMSIINVITYLDRHLVIEIAYYYISMDKFDFINLLIIIYIVT